MHTCACRGKFNTKRHINSVPSGILGTQEEVRAATPQLEGGKFRVLLATTKIKQEANRLY